MARTGVLPPRDVLQEVQGVEEALKKNRKVGAAGWVGVLLSILDVAYIPVAGSGRALLVAAFPFLASGSLYLVGRSRLWRSESREPFRYTCSVASFTPLEELALKEFSTLKDWLRYDLSERLNERIGRLSFLDADGSQPPEKRRRRADEDAWSSHIHISGEYLVRAKGDEGDVRTIEVTPRLRIGGPNAPSTLAHAAKFEITSASDGTVLDTRSAEEQEASTAPPSPGLSQGEYEKLLERVYFSVATQIYRQIRSDVERKIRLLPTRFLRATAHFHEANDYVGSNTLDAYDAARELYEAAMQLYDARLRRLPAKPARRPYLRFLRWKTERTWTWRRKAANYWPRLGVPEVMTARAEIGYASALLYRRILAGMSGHRLNPIFEARPVICRAIRRLEAIPEDVPERKEAMFQAYVTLALAWYLLEATRQAEESLRQARCVLPSRYGVDPRYLYAAGLIESRLRSSVPVLRNAVEQDPRFETAQFHLALRSEMMWRRRPSFESTVAKIVGKEYEQVLKLNPGNIRAWASFGYVWWLQGDGEKAREAFDRGREYKQIQRGTDVGAIDYGLARVAAEEKRLDDAYIHYHAAVCAHVTHGVSDARITSSQYYFFDYVGDAMLARYEAFANAVLEECDRSVTGRDATPRRVRDAVAGFVLNDLGEALHTYYIRNADGDAARRAREAYQEALRRNPTFVLPYYNLYLMAMNDGDIHAALEQIRHVHDLEPTWPDAILARVAALAEWVNDQTWRQPVERRQAQRDGIPTAHAPPRRRAEAGKGTDARVGTTIVLTPDVKRWAQAVTNDTAVMEQLERLVPHSWWWRRADGGLPTFEWQAVQGLDAERARDMDDLHVRSLFMWDIANLIVELEHRPLEEPAVPADPEAPADPETTSMARLLLDKIKEHFWPANPRVLLTWRQIHRDDAADEDLRALVRHWLGADPTSQWALQHLRREFFDFYGNKVALFEEEEQRAYLEKARDECHLRLRQADGADRAMSSVLAWVEVELGSMRAAEASADGKETSPITETAAQTEASSR